MKPHVSISYITFSDGYTMKIEANDKVLVVGPNNSGKSLSLREMVDTVAIGEQALARNLVIKGLQLTKRGQAEELRFFLQEHAEDDGVNYRYNNWTIKKSLVQNWDGHYLQHIHQAFIKNINAETRLEITKPQNAIGAGEHKERPQHVLYDDLHLMQRVSDLFKKAFNKDIFFDFRSGRVIGIHVGITPEIELGEDRVSDSYVKKVRGFPLLHDQGDGVKSYAGILFETVAAERDITLIDEPEAFLHPPQMRKLGETLAQEVGGQLFIATHSSDVMRGFLSGAGGHIKIVRMQLRDGVNIVTEAPVELVKQLWEQPALRYSNALEGVFHDQAIICEDDSDCRLLNSVADHLERINGENWKDTAYVPAGGKHGIHRIAEVLRQVGVPVKGFFDIDFLSEKELVKKTVVAFGGNWDEIEPLWGQLDAAVRDGIKPSTNDQIKEQLKELIDGSGDGLPSRSKIIETIKQTKPWAVVKNIGSAAIPNGQAQEVFGDLNAKLMAVGIYINPLGEIENFCPQIGLHGPKFVGQLLNEIPLDSPELEDLRKFTALIHE